MITIVWLFLFYLLDSILGEKPVRILSPQDVETSLLGSSVSKCFLHNVRPCKQGEGIGGLFRRMEWILAIAAKFGCSYVCNVDDWPAGPEDTTRIIRENAWGVVGMGPLIINPIYALYSGYLLGISWYISF